MPLLIGMQHKFALAITAALVVAASARHASAGTQWFNSTPITSNSPTCSGTATTTYTGYQMDPNVGLKSGDIGYIHFVAIAGCAKDTVGFDTFLQTAALEAASAGYPVYCYFNNNLGVPSSVGACSQTPSNGNYGGPLYGWATLQPGESFEIMIPVQWAAPGPFEGVMESAVSVMTPTMSPMLKYQPYFQHLVGTSSSDGTSASVTFELDHWYTASSVVVEYGTGVFDHSVPVLTADAKFAYYTGIAGTLANTSPNTLLTWRVRITNQWGTFYSPTQVLALKNTLVPLGPPRCTTRFC